MPMRQREAASRTAELRFIRRRCTEINIALMNDLLQVRSGSRRGGSRACSGTSRPRPGRPARSAGQAAGQPAVDQLSG
jgi:hypothetical protein